MQARGRGRREGGPLAVCLAPDKLVFVADQPETHKQILTLFNPYNFSVAFQVLSTASTRYRVVDPEGIISAKCLVDITVRHREVNAANVGHTDQIRVQMRGQEEHGSMHGHRDIDAQLVATLLPPRDHPPPTGGGRFEHLALSSPAREAADVTESLHTQHAFGEPRGRVPGSPGATVVAVAIACVVALMLPTEGDRRSQLPQYLHLSVTQKMIAAYILGLVTLVIFRY